MFSCGLNFPQKAWQSNTLSPVRKHVPGHVAVSYFSNTIFRMDESKYRNSKQLCDYCFRHINKTNCIDAPVSQSLLLLCYDDTSLMCAPLAARHTKRQSSSCSTHRRFRSDNVDLRSWFYLPVPPHWLDLLNGWQPWQNLKIKSI
jgi:hypothetical protein